MRTKSIKTFTATITIGLEIGYTKENYSKEYLINELQEYQRKRIDESSIYDLISELRTKIAEFKEDYLHTKNPSALKHLRNRMYYSKDIYRKYIQ